MSDPDGAASRGQRGSLARQATSCGERMLSNRVCAAVQTVTSRWERSSVGRARCVPGLGPPREMDTSSRQDQPGPENSRCVTACRTPESWSHREGAPEAQLGAPIQTALWPAGEGTMGGHGDFLVWILSYHHRIWRLQGPRTCHPVRDRRTRSPSVVCIRLQVRGLSSGMSSKRFHLAEVTCFPSIDIYSSVRCCQASWPHWLHWFWAS